MKKIIQAVFILIGFQTLVACENGNGIGAVDEQVNAIDFVHEQMPRTTDEAIPVGLTNMDISFTEDTETFDFLFNE